MFIAFTATFIRSRTLAIADRILEDRASALDPAHLANMLVLLDENARRGRLPHAWKDSVELRTIAATVAEAARKFQTTPDADASFLASLALALDNFARTERTHAKSSVA